MLLHWENKDQYYNKSGENFGIYCVKFSDGKEVFFRLIALNTVKDNRKDNEAKIIEKQNEDSKILEICFEYRPA